VPNGDFLAANSLYIENTLRHAFLFALARHLLLLDPPRKLAILNAEVDDSGVDLVLALGGVTRHVQMKTRNRSHAPNAYAIAESLFDLPGGCVVWMNYDAATMEPTGYHFLGRGGNEAMGDAGDYPPSYRKKDGIKIPRLGYRDVKSRQATRKDLTIGKLADALFESSTERE
jgi:hypothetical protein